MIYEIRNYHYEPTLLPRYKVWAEEHALPYLRANLDLVGFWTTADEPAIVTGAPLDELGSATVTWIIRWPDMATRHASTAEIYATDEWRKILETHPGRQYYHRVEAKFAEEL